MIPALSEEGAGIFPNPSYLGLTTRARRGRLDSSLHKLICVGSNPTLPAPFGEIESYLTHPRVEWGKILPLP